MTHSGLSGRGYNDDARTIQQRLLVVLSENDRTARFILPVGLRVKIT